MTERSYSYSIIQSAYRCLQFYKLLYVDKIRPPVAPSGDMAFGTAMHSGIQAILEGEDGLSVFRLFWDSEKEKEMRYSRSDWEALKDQGEILLTRFQRLHAKKFKIHKMEERLYSTIDGVRLEGTPDFVGDYDGVPSIVDFKTAAYPYPKEKLVCNEQMPLYAHMAEKEWGYKAQQYVYVVLVKGREPRVQTITLPLDRAAQEQTLSNILAVCRDLDTRTHFTQNRGSCIVGTNKCDYFSRCFPDARK